MDETLRGLEEKALQGDRTALERLRIWWLRGPAPLHLLNKGVLDPGAILQFDKLDIGDLHFDHMQITSKVRLEFESYGQMDGSWFHVRAARTDKAPSPIGLLPMMPKPTIYGHVASCSDLECMRCGMLCCPVGEPGHFWKDGCPCCSFTQYTTLQGTHPFGPVVNVHPSVFDEFEESFHV